MNQKRRTRAAIVEAARELFAEGRRPTVQQAAERARVGRTTAYRYFPTQDSLLVEVAVNVDVDDVEALVATPLDAADVPARLLEVVDALNAHVLADEAQYRTMLGLYLQQWDEAVARGEADPVVREGRRRRWIASTLDPLRGSVDAEALERLTSALAMVTGSEAVVALRDVAGLDASSARDVARWAASQLIHATLSGPGRARPASSGPQRLARGV